MIGLGRKVHFSQRMSRVTEMMSAPATPNTVLRVSRLKQFNRMIFYIFFIYFVQHSVICHPSNSTVSEDSGVEPKTFAASALAVRRSSNHTARSASTINNWTQSLCDKGKPTRDYYSCVTYLSTSNQCGIITARIHRFVHVLDVLIRLIFCPHSKRQCHEMNNLFEGLKNQISTFCIGFDGFCIFVHLQCLKKYILSSCFLL